MSPAKRLLLFAAVLLCSGIGHGVQFSRDVCETQCTTASDFIENIPAEGPVDEGDNRPFAWSIVAQLQIMFNLGAITPPGAGRVCGLAGTCLFEAAALTTKRKKPVTPDIVFFQLSSQDSVRRRVIRSRCLGNATRIR